MPREVGLRERWRGWFSDARRKLESAGNWLTEDRTLKIINLVIVFAGLLFSSRDVLFGKDRIVFGPRLHSMIHEPLTSKPLGDNPIVLNACTVSNEGRTQATNVTVQIWSEPQGAFDRYDLTFAGAEGDWEIRKDSRDHFYISIPRLMNSEFFRVTVETAEPIKLHCNVGDESGVERPVGQYPFRLLLGDFLLLVGSQLVFGFLLWILILFWVLRSRR